MRRPPDRNGQPVLSERDVDSSNATLNTLFGGSRQKSWMIGPGTPVRPSPRRASISKTSGPPVTLAQRTMAAVLPSPAPSDESSPVLVHSPINNSRHGNQREVPDEGSRGFLNANVTSARDQHPSPSEVESQPRATANWQTNPQISASLPSCPQAQTRAQSTSSIPNQDPQSKIMMENPPLPSSVLLSSARQDLAPDAPGSSTFPEESIDRPPRPELPMSASSGASTVPSPPAAHRFADPQVQVQVSQNTSQRLNSRDQLPSPVQTHTSSPMRNPNLSLPSTMLQNQAQSHTSRAIAAVSPPNTHKRQRVQIPVMPSLKPRVAFIDSHIESVGGNMNLNTGLERPRFQLLRDACNNEDDFYVAMHQIFCVWDFDHSQITSIRGFPSLTVLQVAFKILGQLIRDNDQLAPNHKKWFAQFPSPLPDLLRSSEPYRRTVQNVGIFLGRLASDWFQFSRECSNRGYPPLVDELVNRMWTLSPILQGVLFTATRRNLGANDESVGARMEEMFRKDRHDYQALSARMNTNRPPTEREIHDRNSQLARAYSNLLNQVLQHRQTPASGAGSTVTRVAPLVSSNAYQQGVPSSGPQSHAQPDHTQLSANLPNGSPNLAGNRQFMNGQQLRRTTAGSPNPGVAALSGRPPSVNGHRLSYANTPSPILMQNLSMQSPVQPSFQYAPILRGNTGQMEQSQNPQGLGSSNPNGTVHQNEEYADARNTRQIQHQMAIQQQQQLAAQQMQWQGNTGQTQILTRDQLAIIQQQNQRINQQIQMQQALNSNPVSQVRRDNSTGVNPRERVAPIHNSMPSNGRGTPSDNRVSRSVQGHGPVMSPALMDQVQTYSMTPPMARALIPPLGFVHHSQPINPEFTALHQAHLRSPRLIPVERFPPDMPPDDPARRFYQVVKGFTHDPLRILGTQAISTYEFSISEADFALIAQGHPPGNGQLEDRQFVTGTLQYRLRCVRRAKQELKCSTADFVVGDTVWPENACLDIQHAADRYQLEIRRQNHHGKDLPIDITPYIRNSGPNVKGKITISIPGRRTKLKESSYFFAIEVIEILGHRQIMDTCVQYQHKPASETLNAIKKSLASPALEDDDIAMVTSDLSIELADPFTARIFDIPIRGNSCLHRECFDLETFLLTRNSKPQRAKQPCMVDVWKCPLCGKDARPYSLHIDDFLLGVRDELKKKDMLDVKAIWIDQDGKWRPKEETRSGKRKATEDASDSEDDDAEEDSKGNKNKAAVVIDLDDD